MRKQFLVLQHTPWEGPGAYLREGAKRHGITLEIVRVWERLIPPLAPYAALLVLGGSPNVSEEDRYPFLAGEKQAIRQSLAEDRPYLGFCLGHQLLADALGARVEKNFRPSIGFVTGHLTHDGRHHPICKGLPDTMPLFKWHGQAVMEPVPKTVEILLTSEECQVEAISAVGRPHIIGLQFDNHAGCEPDIANFFNHDGNWVTTISAGAISPEKILAEVEGYAAAMARSFAVLFDNFVDLVKGHAARAPASARA